MRTALLCLLLAGCASVPQGVEMTAEETKACAEQSCSVWTRAELVDLVKRAWTAGYSAGVKSL